MAYAFNVLGVANLVASALLLLLSFLFLKGRRTEFTVAFAVYTGLTATQKLAGGMMLYFSADAATRQLWGLVTSVALLLLIPVLAHALAAFTWGDRFTDRPLWLKAEIYGPSLILLSLVVIDRALFELVSNVFGLPFMLLLVLFFPAVLQKYRRARSRIDRVQSKYLLVYLTLALSSSAIARVIPSVVEGAALPWWQLSVVYMVATGLLLYGILKYHLFTIDIVAKRTTYYTAVTAGVAGVFVVIEQVAEQALAGGDASLIAAVVVAVLVAPIVHLANRGVERLFPEVNTSDDYLSERKEEIYRAQLELALLDGFITREEHTFLEHSRRRLGISEEEHDRLEAELRTEIDANGTPEEAAQAKGA